jgi:uncharacterized protein (DUF2336 family)
MTMAAEPACGPLDYETAKQLARHIDGAVRHELAARADAMPEILVFLVADRDPAVRAAIAANPNTPRQARAVLAEDRTDAVRVATARRIADIVPPNESDSPVTAAVAGILVALSEDGTVAVRVALAEALQHLAATPRPVARRLAGDPVFEVAGPMLRHSPALEVDDLVDLARLADDPQRLRAIARRADLPPEVADVVARSDDVDAVTVLLTNTSAQIREDTLDRVLDRAPAHKGWHRPLVERPSLSARAINRLAEFVALSLIDLLQERRDLSPESQVALAETLARRAREEGEAFFADPPDGSPEAAGADPDFAPQIGEASGDPVAAAIAEARALMAADRLDDACISDAILAGNRPLAVAALTERARIAYGIGDHILQSQSAQAIIALVWRAGLSMALATQVQRTLGRLPPARVLSPTETGGFPIGQDHMEWQLMFFGVDQ